MSKRSTVLFSTVLLGVVGVFALADAPTSQPSQEKKVTPSGLTIIETGKASDDLAAQAGDDVWVDYVGKLQDGTEFDASSKHADTPFIFALGRGKVIPGWDEGIAGMKIGEKRQLIIPPNLAYGDKGAGPIPPNSTLVFDVQLLGVKKAAK